MAYARGEPLSSLLSTYDVLIGVREQDDASALHLPTLRRWNLIMRVFLVQYLGLHPEDGKNVRREEPEPGLVGFADVDELIGRVDSDLVSLFDHWLCAGWSAERSVAVGTIAV